MKENEVKDLLSKALHVWVCGPPCAGKSYVTDYCVKNFGFASLNIGRWWRKKLGKNFGPAGFPLGESLAPEAWDEDCTRLVCRAKAGNGGIRTLMIDSVKHPRQLLNWSDTPEKDFLLYIVPTGGQELRDRMDSRRVVDGVGSYEIACKALFEFCAIGPLLVATANQIKMPTLVLRNEL